MIFYIFTYFETVIDFYIFFFIYFSIKNNIIFIFLRELLFLLSDTLLYI